MEEVLTTEQQQELERAEAKRKAAEDCVLEERRRAHAEEENASRLERELEQDRKEAKEHSLRTLALENFKRQEVDYKQGLEAARQRQENLQKQIDTLKRGGYPSGRTPSHQPFSEEPASEDSAHPEQQIDPTSPLSAELQAAVWPPRLFVVKLPTFRGTTDPREFFIRYETAMVLVGGSENIKARAMPLVLEGIASTGYTKLPAGSITSWPQLKNALSMHFKGNHAKAVNSGDLAACA